MPLWIFVFHKGIYSKRPLAIGSLGKLRGDYFVKIGCSVLDISELGVVKRAGYDYLELMGKYVARLSEREFGQVLKLLEEEGFYCEGLNAYCPEEIVIAGPGFDLGRVRDYAGICAPRAAMLGVNCVGIGSPRSRDLPAGFHRKTADRQTVDFLKATAEVFGRFGIRVCLEPLSTCYCNYINTLTQGAEIVERIGWENIGLLADFYNMEQEGEADRDMESLLPILYHVHISDDAGGPDRRSYLKESRAHIHRRRVGRLYEEGYTGSVSVEIDVPADPSDARHTLSLLKKT